MVCTRRTLYKNEIAFSACACWPPREGNPFLQGHVSWMGVAVLVPAFANTNPNLSPYPYLNCAPPAGAIGAPQVAGPLAVCALGSLYFGVCALWSPSHCLHSALRNLNPNLNPNPDPNPVAPAGVMRGSVSHCILCVPWLASCNAWPKVDPVVLGECQKWCLCGRILA